MIMSAITTSTNTLAALLGSIPSPSTGSIQIGPFQLRAYGLLMALGVIAGIWLAGKLMAYHGVGTSDQAASIGIWGAVGGVIGARLYHVATEWSRFSGNLSAIPKIWEGGLGIPGGLLLGVLFGVWRTRQLKISVPKMLTFAAPSIALGQSIARWGNYFNQELFGKPTTLPWGLQIDPAHTPIGYPPGTLFQPTFLYESLWNLGLCILLLLIHFRIRLAPGRLFGVYLMGYGVGRFWIESLRIDPAPHVAGLRWNQWVALAAIISGAIYLFVTRGQRWPADDWQPQLAHTGHGSTDIDHDETDEHDTADDRDATDHDAADRDAADQSDFDAKADDRAHDQSDEADSDATGGIARVASRRTTTSRHKKKSADRHDQDRNDHDANDQDRDTKHDDSDHDLDSDWDVTPERRPRTAKAGQFYDQTDDDDIDDVDPSNDPEAGRREIDLDESDTAEADSVRPKAKRPAKASKTSTSKTSTSRTSTAKARRPVADQDADHDADPADESADEPDSTRATSRPKTDRPRRNIRGR